ncbi:MAG: alpha/beta fold hydrolase [Anaerolineae bacterium]|nr:alpha/beta fold hydrolase [Anaerolineae bacterium]
MKTSFAVLVFGISLLWPPAQVSEASLTITLLNRGNEPTTILTDGDTVRLRAESSVPVAVDTLIAFSDAESAVTLADCTVPKGRSVCTSELFPALGWYWNPGGVAMPERIITAQADGKETGTRLAVRVRPRPVVMVHGFNADFHTFDTYLGPAGYLEEANLQGFAVGDGQVPGVMNTGSLSDPFARTNTIAENASILAGYIDHVQEITGAEQVDLLVHSMGGMISRYYLDRVMVNEDDVAQMIILGTPMAGSSCAVLPASLGMLLPATIEIQPAYMVNVFNQQIYHRRGVPFHALAGTKLNQAVQSPCTPVPSDIVVTVDSVRAIPMPVEEVALLHTELNTSREAYEAFVLPLLQTPPGSFEAPADPPAGSGAPTSTQFSQVFTGHINPGETRELVIPIDTGVSVANFALYDTSRSLTTIVIGANGNEITLDPVKNGLIRVDDPSTLVYLGYGFNQPRPGQWKIILQTTGTTPSAGADYALAAQFQGGAQLEAGLDVTTPRQGQAVNLQVALTAEGVPVALQSARATLRQPDGSTDTQEMAIAGHEASLTVRPAQPGIYGVEIAVTADNGGFIADRAAFLTFVVEPSPWQGRTLIITVAGGLAAAGAFLLWRLRRRRRKA